MFSSSITRCASPVCVLIKMFKLRGLGADGGTGGGGLGAEEFTGTVQDTIHATG